MLRFLVFAAFLQCCISQQYQQKVAPGVPPQNYQNYQQPPPPPPPQGHQQVPQQQYQQQQYQPPPPQQQQYQQPPPQQQQYQQQPQAGQIKVQHDHHGEPQLLNAANIQHEREHIQEHMDVPIDTSKMSEQELQFHYFKMHDADNNNKLDGCELIKSLIHWHDGHEKKVTHMDDTELSLLTDMVMSNNDYNGDGFIDYAEYKEGMKRTGNRKELELKDGRQVDKNHATYTDKQLEDLLEHVLKHTDVDKDGYIDYLEYRVSSYKAKAKKAQDAAKAAGGK